MKRRMMTLALLAAAATLAGCKDSTGDGDGVGSGSVSFTYTGARSGTYSASGEFEKLGSGSFVKKSFATGVNLNDANGNVIGILGYVPVTATTGHQAVLVLPPVTGGETLEIDPTCEGTTFCPLGLISFNLNPDEQFDDSEGFLFTGGTVHVTSVANGRLKGTFSGTAVDVTGTQTLTVTNGSFDVPLLPESQFLAERRRVLRMLP
ncbi:MAG TPA: hypothetical protein VJT67_16245 [Longimicrobiaceae bacterium]|nr:hypothetical protein [Longimicrobiaceae bacterium]